MLLRIREPTWPLFKGKNETYILVKIPSACENSGHDEDTEIGWGTEV